MSNQHTLLDKKKYKKEAMFVFFNVFTVLGYQPSKPIMHNEISQAALDVVADQIISALLSQTVEQLVTCLY